MRAARWGLAALLLAGCTHAPSLAGSGTFAPRTASSLASPDWLAGAIARADIDRDGRLSAREAGLDAAQFRALDRDRDGRISRREFDQEAPAAVIEAARPAFEHLVDATFAALDADGDRAIALAELHAVMSAPRALAPSDARLAAPFDAADADRDARITRAEFDALYAALGGRAPVAAKGLWSRLGQALMGGYLAVTGRIAASKALHPAREPLDLTPAQFGFAYDDLTLRAEDGTSVSGWFIPAARPSGRTVVLVHGFQTNRGLWLRQRVVLMLHDAYDLVLIDLRNHGRSGGSVTSFSHFEALDVQAAIDWAENRGAASIGVIGQSLGGASSLKAVAGRPQVKALVTDAAFATVQSAFTGAIASTFAPQPALIAATALGFANAELGIDMTATQPVTQLSRVAPRPVLFVHGEQDPYISKDNAQVLFSSYVGPKSLWICPQALHGDSDTTDPLGWHSRVRALLADAL